MVEASVTLHVMSQGGAEMLPSWGNPIKDTSLKALRVICPGTRGTFLNLELFSN